MLAVLMITPRAPSTSASREAMRAAASRQTLKLPTMLTCSTDANASSWCGSPLRETVLPACRTPAVLSATFTGPHPKLDSASVSAASTSDSEVQSIGAKTADLPSASAAAAPAWLRSASTTLPPEATMRLAAARPRPDAPPETRATVRRIARPPPGPSDSFRARAAQAPP
eukprot:scaffold15922_cov111-Isochrysis_galbana.AAC.4